MIQTKAERKALKNMILKSHTFISAATKSRILDEIMDEKLKNNNYIKYYDFAVDVQRAFINTFMEEINYEY